ncbi:MAG TPA: hypothetical protein DEO32_03370 [Ruminococcaceae bacterium]|nr:hypothetical protein [Oscillospiraceae bacterium]
MPTYNTIPSSSTRPTETQNPSTVTLPTENVDTTGSTVYDESKILTEPGIESNQTTGHAGIVAGTENKASGNSETTGHVDGNSSAAEQSTGSTGFEKKSDSYAQNANIENTYGSTASVLSPIVIIILMVFVAIGIIISVQLSKNKSRHRYHRRH